MIPFLADLTINQHPHMGRWQEFDGFSLTTAKEIILDTPFLYYRLDPRKIVLLKSLLEGHEGLVVVRTYDPKEGIIQLLVSPDFVKEVRAILDDVSKTIWLEPIQPPANKPRTFIE